MYIYFLSNLEAFCFFTALRLSQVCHGSLWDAVCELPGVCVCVEHEPISQDVSVLHHAEVSEKDGGGSLNGSSFHAVISGELMGNMKCIN